MLRPLFYQWLASFALLLSTAADATPLTPEQPNRPIVIAHRGASGYLPEHTLEAKALAYGMRPDYIEQDLVLSKDDHLIVMHDVYLDHTTNVAELFPGRARKDGRYYAIDFTLAELKQLHVSETFVKSGERIEARFPERFPLWKSSFQLSTLEEELDLIQGLNRSLGYDIGIYPEIKKPYFHHREGKDIASKALAVLKKYGYTGRDRKVYLQCFDAEELQRIKRELMPKMQMDLPLVQLIAATEWGEKQTVSGGKLVNYDYDWMLEPGGIEKIAGYADGIGPWLPMLAQIGKDGQPAPTGLIQLAHAQNLEVHPYTFRADAEQIPPAIGSFNRLLQIYIEQLQIDGLFTDHPDKAVAYLNRRAAELSDTAR